jgi:hypothetical protein
LVECVVEEAIEATVQADERVQIRQAELLDYEEENFGLLGGEAAAIVVEAVGL